MSKHCYKVWVEINRAAARYNADYFRELIGDSALWAVVKSNAYGHGLVDFSLLISDRVDGFCVDSVAEGRALRRKGIIKPILVLGPTLLCWLPIAYENNIALTISNFETLKALLAFEKPIDFHIKVDTGMLRQGFYLENLSEAINMIQNSKFNIQNSLKGVYSHFASVGMASWQFKKFLMAMAVFEGAGFKNLIKHIAATAGVLADKKYHLDAVRVGIGLYGFHRKGLKPVLSWHTLISETKRFRKGDLIGYDGSERALKDGRLAILPIGYWHGVPRALSSVSANGGEVLIKGKRAKILGRISMDLTAVDVGAIDCGYGDKVTILGKAGAHSISAEEVANKLNTITYEVLTRINPLIKRILA